MKPTSLMATERVTGLIVFVSLLAPLTATVPTGAWGQTAAASVATAESLYTAKEYPASAAAYRSAFAWAPGTAQDFYNAACSAALAGDTSTALAWLDSAVAKGWRNPGHLETDTDLSSLHVTAGWTTVTGRLRSIVDEIEKNYDKPLQKELIEIYEDDQGIRREFLAAVEKEGWKSPAADSLGKVMSARDSVNLVRIKAILDEKGWLGPGKVGGQASMTLFLVVQHADLVTQQKYLPMMREAAARGDAEKRNLALLEDRVALGEGRKQLYGSQIGVDDSTGKNYVLPLEDPDNVDARRARMDLGPMADYVKRWGIAWDPAQYKADQALRDQRKGTDGRKP
jgi:hypothetical protein